MESQHPLNIEGGPQEEEDRDLESYTNHHIAVKAVPGKKSNLKSRNQGSLNQLNKNFETPNRMTASDFKTHSTLADEVNFPKDKFKKLVSTTYNDWYYDRKS